MKRKVVAGIDLGTNACRLLIGDLNRNEVYKDVASPMLGDGMMSEMKFTVDSMNRTLECLKNFRNEMDKYEVVALRAVATAACRMALNGKEFIEQVKKETGIELEIIDGLEEARLNLKGALVNAKGGAEYVLVYDLGGGSTEITLATNEKNFKIIHSVSIPWGMRNASESFQITDYDEQKAMMLQTDVKSYVDAFIDESNYLKYKNNLACVATSSGPLRLVSMIKNFGKYDRERADGVSVLTKDMDVEIARIFSSKLGERKVNPYIGEKRAPIFVAGCIIFKTIYDRLGIENITASLKSAKDGLVEELLENLEKR